MILGKLRQHIAEIREKYPYMDISITIPSHLPDDYFTIGVFNSSNRSIARRALSMTDLDKCNGNPEELLIMILDKVVEEVERCCEGEGF